MDYSDVYHNRIFYWFRLSNIPLRRQQMRCRLRRCPTQVYEVFVRMGDFCGSGDGLLQCRLHPLQECNYVQIQFDGKILIWFFLISRQAKVGHSQATLHLKLSKLFSSNKSEFLSLLPWSSEAFCFTGFPKLCSLLITHSLMMHYERVFSDISSMRKQRSLGAKFYFIHHTRWR